MKRVYCTPNAKSINVMPRQILAGSPGGLLNTMSTTGSNTNDDDNNLSKRGSGDVWGGNRGW